MSCGSFASPRPGPHNSDTDTENGAATTAARHHSRKATHRREIHDHPHRHNPRPRPAPLAPGVLASAGAVGLPAQPRPRPARGLWHLVVDHLRNSGGAKGQVDLWLRYLKTRSTESWAFFAAGFVLSAILF